jgi:hypothetical protein
MLSVLIQLWNFLFKIIFYFIRFLLVNNQIKQKNLVLFLNFFVTSAKDRFQYRL